MKPFAPLVAFLKQGMSPPRLALCVAIGVVIGNIPILGVSTILCAGVALLFRLNLPAIQIVQAAMAPTQVLLIIPFVRLGEWMVHAPHQPLSIHEGAALIAQGVGVAVVALWDAILHAGLAWIVVAPPAVYGLQRLLTPVFRRVAARLPAAPPPGAATPGAATPGAPTPGAPKPGAPTSADPNSATPKAIP